MEAPIIPAGWLTLRPFTAADTGWVYDVSQDPALQHFVQVPSPYLMQHAEFVVHQLALAGWDSGQRAEFLAEDTGTGTRLGRVGLDLRQPGTAQIGYWTDARARNRGVATSAVRTACHWAFTVLAAELIEWRCEAGNMASRRVAERAGFLIEATLRKRLIQAAHASTHGSAPYSAPNSPARPASVLASKAASLSQEDFLLIGVSSHFEICFSLPCLI